MPQYIGWAALKEEYRRKKKLIEQNVMTIFLSSIFFVQVSELEYPGPTSVNPTVQLFIGSLFCAHQTVSTAELQHFLSQKCVSKNMHISVCMSVCKYNFL